MTNRILSKRCQLVRQNTSIALDTLYYLLLLLVLECNVVTKVDRPYSTFNYNTNFATNQILHHTLVIKSTKSRHYNFSS